MSKQTLKQILPRLIEAYNSHNPDSIIELHDEFVICLRSLII